MTTLFSADNWEPLISMCSSILGPAAPPPPPPGPPAVAGPSSLGSECGNIQQAMDLTLSRLCCTDAACSEVPSTCSPGCADALMPYFRDCAAELMTSDQFLMGQLTSLARVCSASEHDRKRPAVRSTSCRYQYNGRGSTWAEAEAACVAEGGHLASIHSDEQMTAIAAAIPRGGFVGIEMRLWIGLNDIEEEAGCSGDNFRWADASAVDYTNWADGEPNDWGNGQANCDAGSQDFDEDCVLLVPNESEESFALEGGEATSSYQWSEMSCDSSLKVRRGICRSSALYC